MELHYIIGKVQCAHQNRKGWGRATRILTAFDGASSDLLLSGLALSGEGYFWQKPPVVPELRDCHGNSKSYHCCGTNPWHCVFDTLSIVVAGLHGVTGHCCSNRGWC